MAQQKKMRAPRIGLLVLSSTLVVSRMYTCAKLHPLRDNDQRTLSLHEIIPQQYTKLINRKQNPYGFKEFEHYF